MDNSAVRSGKFVCPKDFTEMVNTEGLCHEDIDDDSELFIIQAPVDADLKKLHDQQLVLSEPTVFCYSAEHGKEEMYKCTTAAVDSQFAKASLILPERDSLKLCAAEKGIKGVIYIEKRVAFSQICYPKELYDKAKTPLNLKKWADPLSSGNSTVLSGDYGKKGASEDSTEDLPRADDLSSQRGRKKKHNQHIIQDENPPEDNISAKSKKKHKQSRRDQVTHIQDEVFSDSVLESAKSKNKIPMDPEYVDSQMSHSDGINSKNSASTKKKEKKHGGGDDTSHEVEESELSEKMSEAGSREHSPQKRNKKKDKSLNSSVSDPHFVDSQEQKKRKNGKTKNDKSEISNEENHNNESSSSSYASNYKIKLKMEEDHMVEGNSSYTNQHNGINSGELSSRIEKKTKKKKKKVNSDDQNSGAELSNIEIKEEITDDYIMQGNSSCMDSPNEELSPDKKRKSKKKKKDDS